MSIEVRIQIGTTTYTAVVPEKGVAQTAAEIIAEHFVKMLPDSGLACELRRETSLAKDMTQDETHDRYEVGRLSIHLTTPTLTLDLSER